MTRLLGSAGLLVAFLLALGSVGANDAEKKEKGKFAEAMFKKLDANGDGVVSKEEFNTFLEKAKEKGGEKGAKFAEFMGKRFDELNKDGKGLTLAQFRELRPGGPGAGPGDGDKGRKFDAEAIFKKVDANGDGRISKEEFNTLLERVKEKGGEKGEKRAEEMSKRFDELNKDGKGLTLEQFREMRPRGPGELKKGKSDEDK